MRSRFTVLIFSCAPALILFFSILSERAVAAGFEVVEQSAQGLGSGLAGATAGFGDGSEVYFNPAAMSQIQENTASVSVHLVVPNADFSSSNTTLHEKDDGTSELSTLTNAYFVAPINHDLRLGFGVNSPFGLQTDYDADWTGRYHATRSELNSISLIPAISYRAWDCECGGYSFSLGAAANVYYLDTTLENAVDFGTIGHSSLGSAAASGLGLVPRGSDGYAKIDGSDWATGFTLGGLFTYDSNRSSIGVAWRSRVQSELSGDAKFTVPSAAQSLQASGLFTNSGVTSRVTLPESISIGGQHWIDGDTALLYDAQWTRWSRFSELRFEFDTVQPDSVTNENWDNVYRFSLGAKHIIDDSWTVRGGFMFDGSPVSDAEHRTPRVPDANRYWLATGVSYKVSYSTSLDISYAHIFVKDESTSLSSPQARDLSGDWDTSVDVVAVGLVTEW